MTKIERQRQQIDKLLAERSAHHWAETVDLFAGDQPAFEDVPSNTRHSGRAGIAEAYQALIVALPDLKFEVVNELDMPDVSVRELLIDGTHTGPYQGMPAKGRAVRVCCACFFHFDKKGNLATERIYFDNETLLRQMVGKSVPYVPDRLRIAA